MSANGYQTLAQMTSEVGYYLNNVTAATASKIKAAINRRYQWVAGSHEWPQLVRADESGLRLRNLSTLKTLESGESEAPLPVGAVRLISLHHQASTSGLMLEARSVQSFYDEVADRLSETGEPQLYTTAGYTAQYRRLAAASTLTVSSTVSGNDNVYVARIHYRGKNSGHVEQVNWDDVTGTFSTGVALAGGATFDAGYQIEKVVLPVGWVGGFSIADASGNLIVNIQHVQDPNTQDDDTEIVYTRPLIRVWPVPDGDYGLTVTWIRDVLPLTEDRDTPLMPVSRCLVEGAVADMLRQRGELQEAREHEGLFAGILTTLTAQQQSDAQKNIVPRGRNMLGSVGMYHYR